MLTQSHAVAGPIYVCDAAPGDVLQVDILDLQPRYLLCLEAFNAS